MGSPEIALGVVWFVGFLFSTTVHEAAHAWAALRLGDPTAHHGGQVSLNPLPHVRREPFGMVVVPIATYVLMGWTLGWASAPYDPRWADAHPRRAGWMALAGPAANLLLAALAGLLLKAGLAGGWLTRPEAPAYDRLAAATERAAAILGPEGAEATATLLSVLFTLNLLLFVFNLLPLPPLDGSGALPLVLPDRLAVAYRAALRHPAAPMIGLLLAWWLFPWLFRPLVGLALSWVY